MKIKLRYIQTDRKDKSSGTLIYQYVGHMVLRALTLSCCSLTVLGNSGSLHVPLSLLHRPLGLCGYCRDHHFKRGEKWVRRRKDGLWAHISITTSHPCLQPEQPHFYLVEKWDSTEGFL